MKQRVETMREIILQEMVEERYNRKHIDERIREEMDSNSYMQDKIDQGVTLVNQYLAGDYYPSKNKRVAQLKGFDIRALVTDIFIGVAYSLKPELFTSAAAKMAARLKFSDKTEALTTVGELLAVLCMTDAFDICKGARHSSLMLESRIPLSEQLIEFIEGSQYLPPMVCQPLELVHNYSSGYLTHNDSLMLGNGNHHDGDFCLDVLNTMNSVALTLDPVFLDMYPELPTFKAETQDQIDQWEDFVKQSRKFYALMLQYGNKFYLTHKIDKRGRIYAQGYHISTQSTSYKKAMLELSNKEIVTGVPT